MPSNRAYLHWALKNPSRFQLTFHAAFDRQAHPEYVEAYMESLTLLSNLIAIHHPAADSELASELIWSSVHGIAELGLARRLRDGAKDELEQLAEAAVDTLLAGLRSRRR